MIIAGILLALFGIGVIVTERVYLCKPNPDTGLRRCTPVTGKSAIAIGVIMLIGGIGCVIYGITQL